MSQLPTEAMALVAKLDPNATPAGDHNTDWINAKLFFVYVAVIIAGDMGSSATIDAKIEQATDASGTGAKDVPGTSITQLVDADGDSSKQVLINMRVESLDVNNGFTHIRVALTVAGATSDACALLLGFEPKVIPASENNAASVAEVITA